MRLFVTALNILTLALLCAVIAFFPQLIQLNSLFLTDSLGLGKNEAVPRGGGRGGSISITVTANLKASRPSKSEPSAKLTMKVELPSEM